MQNLLARAGCVLLLLLLLLLLLTTAGETLPAQAQAPLPARPKVSGGPPAATALGFNAVGGLGEWPSGASWVRLWDAGVAWPQLEPRPGEFHWRTLDTLVRTARDGGGQVILTLGQTPTWAAPRIKRNYTGGTPTAPPTAAWRRYVGTVAARYCGRIAAYELWNEPDLPLYWRGTTDQLAALSAVAYPEIKARCPAATVLTPGWTARGDRQARQWVAAGGLAYADAVAFHTYPQTPDDAGTTANLFRSIAAAGQLPVWATEVGCDAKAAPVCASYDARRSIGFALTELHALRAGGAAVVIWYGVGTTRRYLDFVQLLPYLPSRAAITW